MTRVGRLATVVTLVIVLTNGPVFLLAIDVLNRPGHWEDPAVWPFFAAAGIVPAVLLVLDRSSRPPRPRTGTEWAAVTAVLWYSLAALLSSTWSVDGSETLWRATVYVGLALLAWLMSAMSARDLQLVLAAFTATAVTTSAILMVVWPHLGFDSDGHWQGVYTNRNSLAPIAALGLLVGLRYLVDSEKRSRMAASALCILSLAALAGAGSRTAWLAFGVAAVVAAAPIAYHQLRDRCGPRKAQAISAVAATAGATGAAVTLAALWDVSTFEQRRTIWSLVWERVLQRPVGGHGFFTFWDIGELTNHVMLRRGSAHSSIMEVALGLGLLGFIPFAIIVVLAARQAGLQAWRQPSAETWLWAAVVAFLLMENLTESFVLWFSYNWVLVMTAALRPR